VHNNLSTTDAEQNLEERDIRAALLTLRVQGRGVPAVANVSCRRYGWAMVCADVGCREQGNHGIQSHQECQDHSRHQPQSWNKGLSYAVSNAN
jgi:hypothetical protein